MCSNVEELGYLRKDVSFESHRDGRNVPRQERGAFSALAFLKDGKNTHGCVHGKVSKWRAIQYGKVLYQSLGWHIILVDESRGRLITRDG